VAVGVIDVGSNSVRLLVAVLDRGTLAPMCEERARLALGDDVERLGRISAAKLRDVARTARSFALIAREHRVDQLEVLVTAPGRQSANFRQLVDELVRATGALARVISAEEEGRLAYEGAAAGLPVLPRTLAVCDVGGGSTEAVVGMPDRGPVWLRSFDVGAVRLTRRYLATNPPARTALAEAEKAVDTALAGAVPPLCERALATGGTPRALRRIVGETLGADELDDVLETLAERPARAIAAAFGIDRRRAGLLPAGTLILRALQCRLVVPLEVSQSGLREGAALALLAEEAAA
jgi:exopolyphosphatase / guanosine-5'-triphosphate,3'-diphosphate pyrophosphatase